MRKMIIYLLLCISFLQTSITLATENNQNWKKINELSEHVLQLGKQKKYEEAKKIIENFSSVFLKNASEKNLTIEEMKIVIYAYEQAESALTSIHMEDEERLNKLLQFRLTVNALTNKHHPLWRDTENLILEPLNKAIEANKKREYNQFQMYLNEFFTNYEIIRPSLMISLPEHEYEKFNSYINYLENYRNQLADSPINNNRLLEIKREFQLLFQDQQQSNAEPELINLIYLIGSIIAVTLIYVGWRKYKGDKQRKQMTDRDK